MLVSWPKGCSGLSFMPQAPFNSPTSGGDELGFLALPFTCRFLSGRTRRPCIANMHLGQL
jgi:hypothetical protein